MNRWTTACLEASRSPANNAMLPLPDRIRATISAADEATSRRCVKWKKNVNSFSFSKIPDRNSCELTRF